MPTQNEYVARINRVVDHLNANTHAPWWPAA